MRNHDIVNSVFHRDKCKIVTISCNILHKSQQYMIRFNHQGNCMINCLKKLSYTMFYLWVNFYSMILLICPRKILKIFMRNLFLNIILDEKKISKKGQKN